MSTPALKSFAKKANVSIETAETKWDEAKKEVDNGLKTTDPKQYWARVMWLTQKKLGLKEERLTFKEYAEAGSGEVDLGDVGYAVNPVTGKNEPIEPVQAEMPPADPDITLTSEISCFVSCLFGARDQAHVFHLNTKSYSEHKALEELYELLLDHADKWAEVGQGMTGFPIGWCLPDTARFSSAGSDPMLFIKLLSDDLRNCHEPVFAKCPVLSNMLQELQAEVFRIKYKLEQLK